MFCGSGRARRVAPPFILSRLIALVALAFVTTGCDISDLVFQKTKTPPEIFAKIVNEYGWELHHFKSEPGIDLVGLEKVPTAETSHPWVLFFGGNGMPIYGSAWALEITRGESGRGLAVYAYRGYDGSTGKATEAAVIADGVKLAENLLARRGLAPDRLYIAGHSLGAAVAAQVTIGLLANGIKPAGLLLMSPFTRLKDAAMELLPVIPGGLIVPDWFNTRGSLPKLKLPVLIMHSRHDEVISVEHGRILARELGSRARYVEFEKTGHNNIFEEEAINTELEDFIR